MKKKRQFGIITQVAILFAIGVIMTGILTFFSQHTRSYANVKKQTESFATESAEEAMLAVREYPAYRWLIRYWHEHPEELDMEYDADFGAGTRTEEKCRLFDQRNPDLPLRYADAEEIEALPEEDQKLYAEITYSWLISRVNQIKRTYQIDYLFCVLTDDSYDHQFFLFSASDENAVRGSGYEEFYYLGKTVTVSESQTEAMRSARENASHLADAGEYVDYYAYLDTVDNLDVFIGITYSLADMQANVRSQTWRGTLFAVIHQIGLSLLCLLLIYFFVLRPLKKVQQNIRLYKQTKDSGTVRENLSTIQLHNEIGQLSEDVVDLTEEIDNYLTRIETITSEKERISAEMALASRVQSNTLPNAFPPFPDRKEFDLYASMKPAKAVGGDFYDFFMIDDDHLALVVADVSGKGVPAALFMMVSMILLHNRASNNISPASVLQSVNEDICSHNPEEMFVSAWLGILEISTGKLTAANAGHEYPAMMKPGGRFAMIKDKHGLVLGCMPGATYTEYELKMEPGTKLFLYTDGVPEATDANEQMFGTGRMLAALNENPELPPDGILAAVRQSVDDFVKDAEQFDDLTMLCLAYNGHKAS